MAIKIYNCTALTGGATRALDAISVGVLTNGDRAHANVNDVSYWYLFDSSATDAESSPDIIRPDDYSTAGVWKLQSAALTGGLYPLPGSTLLTGDIIGLSFARTGDNEVTFQPMVCKDSANVTKLTLSSAQAVDTTSLAGASTWTYFFLCSDGVVRADSSIDGSATLSAYTKRFVGYWQYDSGGTRLKYGYYSNGIIEFDVSDSISMTTNPSTTAFVPTYSSYIPTTRVGRVGLWGKSGAAGAAFSFVVVDTAGEASRRLQTPQTADGADYRAVYSSGELIWVGQSQKIAGVTSFNTGTVLITAIEVLL